MGAANNRNRGVGFAARGGYGVAMRNMIFALAASTMLMAAQARAWDAIEKVETYAVTGQTALDLYRSIGERGPKAGVTRAIAVTTFKLTWTRDYQVREGACVLASAKPKLLITTTLPKPSGKLPSALAARWRIFVDGITRHEAVHGDMIEELVRAIEAQTIGLTVADDPACKKIRAEMTRRLSALSLAQRAGSRDFDRVEMSEGGAVHRLITAFLED